MLKTYVIGFLAGFGTTFAAMPDLIAMLRRRSTRGMNPRMAAILATFQVLWIWYGALIGSLTVIAWNVVAMLTNCGAVAAYLYFRRCEARLREQPEEITPISQESVVSGL